MLSIGQVRTGSKIIFQNAPHEVLTVNHLNLGRGQAKLTTKLRNLLTQTVFETTFQGNDRVEEAQVNYQEAQYLYAEGSRAHFMASETFEQLEVTVTPEKLGFLKEGQAVSLLNWQDRVIDVKLPTKVELEVAYSEPGYKGNTTASPLKKATLETGREIQVPLFINVGDKIRVNTETGAYDSRV